METIMLRDISQSQKLSFLKFMKKLVFSNKKVKLTNEKKKIKEDEKAQKQNDQKLVLICMYPKTGKSGRNAQNSQHN